MDFEYLSLSLLICLLFYRFVWLPHSLHSFCQLYPLILEAAYFTNINITHSHILISYKRSQHSQAGRLKYQPGQNEVKRCQWKCEGKSVQKLVQVNPHLFVGLSQGICPDSRRQPLAELSWSSSTADLCPIDGVIPPEMSSCRFVDILCVKCCVSFLVAFHIPWWSFCHIYVVHGVYNIFLLFISIIVDVFYHTGISVCSTNLANTVFLFGCTLK